MDSGNFINFHCHSEYTFLGSLLKVEDLVGFCAYNGFRGCAVTDTLSTYSFFKLNKLCERENIKPVYGLELFIHGVSGKGHYPVLLIAQNNTGLQNLFTLNSIAHTANLKNHFFVLPFEIVLKYSEGLALISESEFLFHKDNFAYLKRVIERFNECFPNRFFLEVNYTGNSKSSELKEIVNIAQHFELTPIGCTETRYLRNDHEAFHFLNSYRMKSHKKDERGFPIDADGDYHLKRPDEMEACFKNHPDFLENAARLFESIDTHFDIKSFKIPSISKNTSRLRNVVMRKAQRLKLGEEYFQRLEYELEVIENMELSNFFLIIGDIAGFMKHKRIPFGWGRGSSVSSLVLYLLGITRVDPVEHNLIFERFLNPGRKQLPDVDIDVCWKRRGEVFDFICAKYGTNNVSHIAAIDRLLARSAIRETAKAFRLPGSKLQAILARMPYAFTGEMYIQTAIDSEPELKRMFDEDTEVRRFFEIALRIEGVASHTTVHAGGVVILPQGINRYASVEFSRSGDKVCQITKDDIEDTGFIKIDLLGLRAITIIDEAMRLAKIGCIDFQNQAAFDLLSRADAIGVFQLESSGMRDLLKKLKPQSILTLCHVIALYRPGPRKSGMMDEYIRRHAENVPYHIHPAIEPYTRDTKGLFIYQEQVLQIAHFTAGMSWTKADKLRKALSKKHRAPILEMKDEFVRGCIANGLEIDYALQLFGVLVDFGRYGFNLSHSMAYAYNAYAGAFLKANYPIQFFVCSLNNNLDFLSRLNRIISDIKFHGIGILPLDINKSRVMFSIENGTIRSGLTVVKYVGPAAGKEDLRRTQRVGAIRRLFKFLSADERERHQHQIRRVSDQIGRFRFNG